MMNIVHDDYLYSTQNHHHHLSNQSENSQLLASQHDLRPYYPAPLPFIESETAPNLYGLVTATPVLSAEAGVSVNSVATPYAPHQLTPSHPHSHTHSHHHNYQRPNPSLIQLNVGGRGMSEDFINRTHHSHHHHHHKSYAHHRKRKSPLPMVDSEGDDDSETCSSRRTATPTDESSKKQNHSEIEKRRRDKMNTYISELSGIVPMCNAMSRKLDKLTVLRMAVQHMKTLGGSKIHSYTEGHYKPSFLTDDELKHLILQSADGFLFVVGCDRGRLLYVSESVAKVLNYTQSDLLGQSWFDILHPKDVAKVKEQLSASDLSPRERLIDAKTMLPVPVKGNVSQKANRLCPGARRSFFCRMKCKNFPVIKEESDSSSSSGCQRRKKSSSCERKFCVVHCTGYLKSWAKVGMEDGEGETEDPCNLSCLVAVGRILKPIPAPSPDSKHRPVTFVSRHAVDGKFVFVDQRTTLVVGFLPQELLGTSMYEYFHHDDIARLAEVHKTVLISTDSITTPFYRFRTKGGTCVRLQSAWKAFRNPWTRDIEYIIAKNTLSSNEPMVSKEEACPNPCEFDFFTGNVGVGMGNGEIQRLINSEVPYRKIGEEIADEVIESQRRNDSPSNSPASVLEASALGSGNLTELQIPSLLSPIMSSSASILQNIPTLSAHYSRPTSCSPNISDCPGGGGDTQLLVLSNRTSDPVMGSTGVSVATDDEMLYLIGESVLPESPHRVTSGDGNDEAAMAVIMSLLEADAGLGGPVDFSGLPWPLP